MANKKEVRVPPKAGKVIDAKSVEGAANRARTSQLGSNGKTRELKYWRGAAMSLQESYRRPAGRGKRGQQSGYRARKLLKKSHLRV